MSHKIPAPYGTWESPITTDWIVSENIGLGQIRVDGNLIYWKESRPCEGGRGVIVCRDEDGNTTDVTPKKFYVRTTVNEYGGGDYTVKDGVIYFCNYSDQKIYRQEISKDPIALTKSSQLKFSDLHVDSAHQRLLCVREDFSAEGEPKQTIVGIPLPQGSDGEVLASGYDFYAYPRLNPQGDKLAWICWNHPNMPWDGTELWVSSVEPDGRLKDSKKVAGGKGESIFQPEWAPDGRLYFISDKSNWWNLYRLDEHGPVHLYEMDAEFGRPMWVFGLSTYKFLNSSEIVCAYVKGGIWHLGQLNVDHATLKEVSSPFTDVADLQVTRFNAILNVGSFHRCSEIVFWDLASHQFFEIKSSSKLKMPSSYLSVGEPIEFKSIEGETAFGTFYEPRSADFEGSKDELPPLLVRVHGGPTSMAVCGLDLVIQYWASRGFAVLDLNYGGSTGFGRHYRNRLLGRWGVVDVEDAVNGVKFLSKSARVDGKRVAIRGGSAGGYTTFAALAFKTVFKAGASYCGISDLKAMIEDTHKFESKYLECLVGPYPEKKALFEERSPLTHADQIKAPLIIFQGLEDRVVPPNQSEAIVKVLKTKGVEVEYIAYEGEQHGLRQGKNIKDALERELAFYKKVLLKISIPKPNPAPSQKPVDK